MCFLCNDSGEVFILSSESHKNDSNGLSIPQPCPMCCNFSLAELNNIVKNEKITGNIIASIDMSVECYNLLKNTISLCYKNDNLKYPSKLIMGIPIKVKSDISGWKVKYYN